MSLFAWTVDLFIIIFFGKAAFPIIDRLLESAQPSDKLTTLGDMIGATDCIAFPESSQFQVITEIVK